MVCVQCMKGFVFCPFTCRKLFALSLNATSGEWVNEELCLGAHIQCHSGLVGSRLGSITSLAEDEDGGWLHGDL